MDVKQENSLNDMGWVYPLCMCFEYSKGHNREVNDLRCCEVKLLHYVKRNSLRVSWRLSFHANIALILVNFIFKDKNTFICTLNC